MGNANSQKLLREECQGDAGADQYEDGPGFCSSPTLGEIRKNGYVLMPGRYVGAEVVEEYGEPFEEKMQKLAARLGEQFQESALLEAEIRVNVKGLGCEI